MVDQGSRSSFRELGVSGLPQFGGIVMVETDPKLSGILGVRKYDMMRRTDPTAAAMYAVLSLPIRRVTWSVKPGGPTSADEEAAQFCWSAFEDCTHTFADLVSDICLMFPYGWSWFDMSMKRRSGGRRSKYDDGRVGFAKIAYRSPKRLSHWEFAEGSTDLLGMWQVIYPGETTGPTSEGIVLLPLYRGLLFRTSREGGDPEGLSVYRPAVRPFDYKRRLEQVEGIGLYRRWAGFPLITLPDSATSRDEVGEGEVSDEERAEDLVLAIYEDRMMGTYTPAGWEIEFGGPQGAVDPTMSNTIIRKDAEMSRAILAQWLMLGSRDVGTQALATTLLDMFYDSCDAFLSSIAQELNQRAIPYLFRFNPWPGLTAYPTLIHTSTKTLELPAVGEFVRAVAAGGLLSPDRPTENFLRSLIPGMPDALQPEGASAEAVPTSGDDDDADDGGDGDGDEDDAETASFTLRGRRDFAGIPAADRPRVYQQMTDAHAAAQRANLVQFSEGLGADVGGMGEDASPDALRAKLDDAILLGLLMFREQSAADIAAAFWLGYGQRTGGSEALAALQREVELADQWMGYGGAGVLLEGNPAGKSTLFGDIRGELEGQIGAILLLLKEGREEDVVFLVTETIRGATQGYSRAELYSGHIWRATWSGALERARWEELNLGIPFGPVRWVLDALAKHCRDCPLFGDVPPGREYSSVDALFAITGGTLPGYGTECDGRCRCHLERQVDGRWEWVGYG